MIHCLPLLCEPDSRQSQSGAHAISIDKFSEYVAAMHQDNNAGFTAEFKVKLALHCIVKTIAVSCN